MRMWNLTDQATPRLRQYGLVDQTFAIGTRLLTPGTSLELEDSEHLLPQQHAHLIEVGALYVGDRAPEGYAQPAAAPAAEPLADHPAPEDPLPLEKKKKADKP